MANSGSDKHLMRECVPILYATAKGVLNTVFDIAIPEDHALELHACEFILGSTSVANLTQFFLVDDIDETANPGHSAEKVLASTIIEVATAVGVAELRSKHDCHKQMLVRPPNFICDTESTNQATSMFCRIWFDFVKVAPKKILEILKQQMY